MLELFLVALGTCLATGLGAIPVYLLGSAANRLSGALLGVSAGVMTVAAVAGLLLPAVDEGTAVEVVAGLLAGVVFLAVARRRLIPPDTRATARARGASLLVFAVLFVHSLPEGFALGTAYASDVEGLALFIVVAITIQNIPEGTSVAIPMQQAGYGAWRQFWAAVGTSLPQPIGAVIAYMLVEEISALLPVSFAFAGGAMLALVVLEVFPEALREDRRQAFAGAAVGAGAMLGLSLALGV